jgi:hypothetical protein
MAGTVGVLPQDMTSFANQLPNAQQNQNAALQAMSALDPLKNVNATGAQQGTAAGNRAVTAQAAAAKAGCGAGGAAKASCQQNGQQAAAGQPPAAGQTAAPAPAAGSVSA